MYSYVHDLNIKISPVFKKTKAEGSCEWGPDYIKHLFILIKIFKYLKIITNLISNFKINIYSTCIFKVKFSGGFIQ